MLEKSITWFFLLVSMGYLFLAHSLKFGTVTAPKSGFLPVLAGSAAVLLSFLLVVRRTRTVESSGPPKTSLRRFLLVLLGLFLYIMLLNVVPYFLASFIILIYFFKITDTAGWSLPIAVAAGASLICYLVFIIRLGIVFQ